MCVDAPDAIFWWKWGYGVKKKTVEGALAFVWMIIEPFLFGLVGSEIRIDYLKPSIVGLGLATLFFGIAARMLAAFASAFSAGLTLKEQIFVTFAGLPKATVQAAIGPVALSLARKQQLGPEAEEFGITILTTAVLSILIAAPLGATSIALLAPRLLEKDANNSDHEKQKPDTTDDGKQSNISNGTKNSNKIQSTEKL
ncbi:Sodium/hydrogen exchanger 9B2 [Araneus ventricosus]|uniref:Sodium/hydrogen exchanger 9B2 n=1 Tax=Araneus ventricosus TaxID=182803 RepID=A0A4Y2T0K8_ARAVE|nr:Sodium/hydrogen exchanger 9B2 [Araneus ventricosus]